MIKFNIEKKCFESSEEELENYMKVKLQNSYFNETQITMLSNLVCDFVDYMCDHYKECFGNISIILNSIIDDKQIKGIAYGKSDKLFTALISYSAGQRNQEIDLVIGRASKIYHLTTLERNPIIFLNLEKLGKNNGYSTEEQRIEVRNLVMDFLKECRDDIEISNIYKLQKERNQLFSDKNRLMNHFSDLIEYIEKKNNVRSPNRDQTEQKFDKKRKLIAENAETSELEPRAKKTCIENKNEELCIAAGSGNEQRFLSLLDNGADINHKTIF